MYSSRSFSPSTSGGGTSCTACGVDKPSLTTRRTAPVWSTEFVTHENLVVRVDCPPRQRTLNLRRTAMIESVQVERGVFRRTHLKHVDGVRYIRRRARS